MANETEKMIIAGARLLPKDTAIYVGTGMPLLASMLALRTHAPDLLFVYEGGGVGGQPSGRLPIQVSESLTYEDGVIVRSEERRVGKECRCWCVPDCTTEKRERRRTCD